MKHRRSKTLQSLQRLFLASELSRSRTGLRRRTVLSTQALEDRVVPVAEVTNLGLSSLYTNLPPSITAMVQETESASVIGGAEYFFDAEPAEGMTGTAMSAADGAYDGNAENIIGIVSEAEFFGLADGLHTVYVRGYSASGADGPFASIQFVKDTDNDAPAFDDFDATPQVLKTHTVTVSASATDTDSTSLVYSLYGAPDWATIDAATGLITLTPGFDTAAGSYDFDVIVTDNGLLGNGIDPLATVVPITTTVYSAGLVGDDLYVYGSSGDDSIDVTSADAIEVIFDGSAVPILLGLTPESSEAANVTLPAGGKIVVIAGDGTNLVTVSGPVAASVTGGSGSDYLRGGDGDDTLVGLGGSDVLDGWAGNDVLEGGNDNDWLVGGTGANIIRGGAGDDRLIQTGDSTFDLVTAAYVAPNAAMSDLLADSSSVDIDYALGTARLVATVGGTEIVRVDLPENDVEFADMVGGDGDNRFEINDWSGDGSLTARGGLDTLSLRGSPGLVDVITITDTSLTFGQSYFALSGFDNIETNGITGEDTIGVSGELITSFTNTGNEADIRINLSGANFQSLVNYGNFTSITIDLTGADFGTFTSLVNSGSGVTIDISGAAFDGLLNTGNDTVIDVTGADFGTLVNTGSGVVIDVSGATFSSLVNEAAGVEIDISGANFGSLINQGDDAVIDISGANFETLTNLGDDVTITIDPTGADFGTFTSLQSSGDRVQIDVTGASFDILLNLGNEVTIDATGANFETLLSVTADQLALIISGADFGSLTGSQNLDVLIDVSGANFETLVSGGDDSAIDVSGANFTTLVNLGDGVEIDASGADFSSLTGPDPETDLSGADFGTLVNYGDGALIDVSGAVFGILANYGDNVRIDAGTNTGADFSSLTGPDLLLDLTGADFSILVNAGEGVTIDVTGADFGTLVNLEGGKDVGIDLTGADFGGLVNAGDGVTIDASGAAFGSLINQAGAEDVTIDLSGADFGTLTNEGDGATIDATGAVFESLINQQGADDVVIDATGAEFGSLVSMGDAVTIDAGGASFQLVSVSGNFSTHIFVQGGSEANSIILAGNGHAGVTVEGGDGGDVFVLLATNSTIDVKGQGGSDRFVIGSTAGLSAFIDGGSGDDSYLFSGSAQGGISLVEPPDSNLDTIDFSAFTGGPIVIDLAVTTAQTASAGLMITLSSGLGIENAIGTDKADVILGNGRSNILLGSDILDDRIGPGAAWNGKIQYVVLDFDTFTNQEAPGLSVPESGANDGSVPEYVYTAEDRARILSGVESLYASFLASNGGFLEFRTSSQGLAPGEYATVYFNRSRFEPTRNPDGSPSGELRPQPGGDSSQVDFRNTEPGGWATVQINGLLGGSGQPAASPDNLVAGSVWLAAHELGHLLGLRHSDSFGPIGFGINAPPGINRFVPVYPGPTGGFETNSHVMATPAATGFTLEDLVSETYFGERELVKLAYARVVPETPGVNGLLVAETSASSTGQGIGLVSIDIAQGERPGLNGNKRLAAAATTVIGYVSAAGEKDNYTFVGRAGDLMNIEVFSRGILADRYADTLDTIVRVLKDGVVVAQFEGSATNDDQFEFDTSIVDLYLPEDGTYTIEVSAFAGPEGISPGNETGHYELFVYRFETANVTDEGDRIEGRGGDDVLEGGPGDDRYVFAGSNLGSDVIREDVRLEALGLSATGRDARDTLDFSGMAGTTTIDLALTTPQIVSPGNLTLKLSSSLGLEDVFMSASGGTAFGNARPNVFFDSPVNDIFDGREADDVFNLSDGHDRVTGGAGDDTTRFGSSHEGNVTAIGGSGADTLDFSARTTGVKIDLSRTKSQSVGGGLTLLTSLADWENAYGSATKANVLTGNELDNILIGGSANDTITGGAGDDFLLGQDGDDQLVGSSGNDILIGGRGSDRMVGSSGEDILISGWTSYDTIAYDPRGVNVNIAYFNMIRAVWNNGQSIRSRRDTLRNSSTGLLRDGIVFDDGDTDMLTGSSDSDLFLVGTGDVVTDDRKDDDLKDPLQT